MVGAGMVSGLAGNAASQGIGMAVGVQKEWDRQQLGYAGLGGAAGGAAAGALTRGMVAATLR